LASKHQAYGERRKMRTKDLALITVFASLYAILTWILAPISFWALQFRVSEALKPAVAKKKQLCIAFMVGNFLANLLSPFAGIFELVFMPVVGNLFVGYLAHKLSRGNYWIAGLIFSTGVSCCVSWMLQQLFTLPMLVTLPMLWLSETIAMTLGSIVFGIIERRWRWF
jgi:uncharacterized membrane protein